MSRFAPKQEPKFSVTVQGDVAGYTKDDVLTKPADIADYLRESFDLGSKDTLALEDEQIIAVAMSIPQTKPTDWDDDHGDTPWNAEAWEITVLEALESRNRSNAPITAPLPDMRSPEVKKASVGSIATAEGERLDTSERFRTQLHEAAEAPIKVKRAALEILRAMLLEFGYKIQPNGELEKWTGHMDTYPRPGSHPINAEGNIDRKWRPRPNERNKYAEYYISATDGTSLKYDWYAALVQGTKYGAEVQKEWQEFQDGMPTTKTHTATGRYKDNKASWIKGKKRLMQDRFNGMVRALKQAVSCYYQLQDINTDAILSKACGARFVFQHDNRAGNDFDAITDSVEPVEVWNRVTQGHLRSYTVSGFNNLDVEAALAGTANYDALINSTARGPNDDKKTKAVAWDMESFMDNYSLLSQFLTTPVVASLCSKVNTLDPSTRMRTEESENMIVQICDMMDNLMPFYNLFGSDARQKIVVRRQQATQELAKEFVPAAKKAS
jgi:hypothetical protein